jgi:Ca2+-binding EF-hand superfamily protein
MTIPSFLSSTTLALFFLAIIGCQTTSPIKTPGRFDRADTNHDGKLSRDEINTLLVIGVFESRDKNHDGRMTPEEWLVAEDAGRAKIFRARDANHDGVVTMQEALAYGRKKGMANELIVVADTNKDGFLSREEFTAYYASKEDAAH